MNTSNSFLLWKFNIEDKENDMLFKKKLIIHRPVAVLHRAISLVKNSPILQGVKRSMLVEVVPTTMVAREVDGAVWREVGSFVLKGVLSFVGSSP